MKAVILAGGLGTRLREETEFRPKPMVEIGGRPILWHIMKTLSTQGINDFVICLGYKGDFIKDYFMNYVVRPSIQWYLDGPWIHNTNADRSKSVVLDKFWVNFQNKHEFNPIHNHNGLFSFVVWMKIPTHHEEQYQMPICKNSNFPSASNFQFTYSDVLGNHTNYTIEMGPYQEGCMLVFPAQLLHQVYPFYNCDEQRVSISGNICWN